MVNLQKTISPSERMFAEMQCQGVTVSAEFVPWSRSRNAAERSPSLNWRVTVKRNGRDILMTDYSAGMGHAPAYKAAVGLKTSIYNMERITRECETGKANNVAILPDSCDVLYSLLLDASVLDYPTYEDWASDFGYDTDSRNGEAIYHACLETALELRAGLGDAGLTALQQSTDGY